VAGSFRDRSVEEEMNRANISEQITVRQGPEARSHTAGFEVRTVSAGQPVLPTTTCGQVSVSGRSRFVPVHRDDFVSRLVETALQRTARYMA